MRDAIHYKVQEEGAVVKKAIKIAIGINQADKKNVLGLWVTRLKFQDTGSAYLTAENRCVSDILLISVDGLSSFSKVIAVVFPKTEIQCCIIHQIRAPPDMSSTRR
jgi:putative transposase